MLRRSLLLASSPALVALLFLACGGKVDATGSAPAPAATGPGGLKPPTSTSVEPPTTPPLREVNAPIVVDLGVVAGGQDVTLSVPAGALGFNVVVEAAAGTSSVLGVERITSPSGEIVHDGYTPKGGNHSTSDSSFGDIASASVPQCEAKSANTPEPGKWIIRIGGGADPPPPPPLDAGGGDDSDAGPLEGGGTYHVTARIQIGATGSTGFAGGRLDMNV